MITYETPEEIAKIFLALRGVHRLSLRARISAVVIGSGLFVPAFIAVGIGAFGALSNGQFVFGTVFAVMSLFCLVFGQHIQWLALNTRYEFSAHKASHSRPASRLRWSVARESISCIELLSIRRQDILRMLTPEGKPHLVPVTPAMRRELITAGVWRST